MSQGDTGKSPRNGVSAQALARSLEESSGIVYCLAVDDAPQMLYANQKAASVFSVDTSQLPLAYEVWASHILLSLRIERDLAEALARTREQGSAQLRYCIEVEEERRTVQDNLTLSRNAKGTATHIAGLAVDVTADMRIQDALLESKAVLQSLVEDLPMNVLRKDLRGRIVFGEPALHRDSMQLELDQLVGKTDFDLFPEHLAQKYTDDDQRVLDSGEPFEDVEEHLSGDGRKTYVQVLKAPVFGADGHVVGLQIMFWDATARKEAELKLGYERYLLHSLLDNVPDSIYFKDADSRFIRVSRGLARKFHLAEPTDAIGKSDADFFSEEHAQAALDDELELLAGGDPIFGKEERETWGEGEDTWCSTTKMALRDADGQIIGTFGISRDVTDEKNAKAQLARERDLLKTIINNVPDLIFVKRPSRPFRVGEFGAAQGLGRRAGRGCDR